MPPSLSLPPILALSGRVLDDEQHTRVVSETKFMASMGMYRGSRGRFNIIFLKILLGAFLWISI